MKNLKEIATDIIETLDYIGQTFDQYEYGLPLYGFPKEKMISAVVRIIQEAQTKNFAKPGLALKYKDSEKWKFGIIVGTIPLESAALFDSAAQANEVMRNTVQLINYQAEELNSEPD